MRQGKCWYDWDKKWESIVAYDRILKKFPTAVEREPALYAIVVALAEPAGALWTAAAAVMTSG